MFDKKGENMPALRRITLLDQTPEDPKSTELLKDLYENFLKHDPEWHFFWEGGVIFVRMQFTLLFHKMGKHLTEKGIPHIVDDVDWEDNIPITKEYQNAFKCIFHGFSEIAMKFGTLDLDTKTTHFFQVMERIHHCFINVHAHSGITFQHALDEFGRLFGGYMGEPMALLLMVYRSVFYSGALAGHNTLAAKIHEEATKKEDDLK